MLNMLLENMGQRLSKKPSEWLSWWWDLKWGSFIDIHPQLTEETPLWSLGRDESSLKSLRLFGLRPDELQSEICHYWNQPFWRRWFARLFTSINSKIIIWSYYQRCMAFRDVQKEKPYIEQRVSIYSPEQAVISELVSWLNRDGVQFENYLEKHVGDLKWIQRNFSLLLIKNEVKREKYFLKLLENKLAKLPIEYDKNEIRCKAEQEYQQIVDALHFYLSSWYKNTYSPLISNCETMETPIARSDILVYVGPCEIVTRCNPQVNSAADSELSCIMSSIGDWVSKMRQTIDAKLQIGTPEKLLEIKALLEKGLDSLTDLVEPQLKNYQYLVNEVKRGNVDYEQAINNSEKLQSSLIKLFRCSVLLYHPDKANGNEDLQMILTEIFKEFYQLSQSSLKTLKEGQQAMLVFYSQFSELKKIYERVKENEQKIARLALIIEEIKAEHKIMQERLNENQKKLDRREDKIDSAGEKINSMGEKIDDHQEKINYIQETLADALGFFSQPRASSNLNQLQEDLEQGDLGENRPLFAVRL